MQIKRFKAKDMSEGMLIVKRNLGSDAVILSSRKIKDTDGSSVMEITAAIEKVATKAEPKDLFAREQVLQPSLPSG